MELTEAEVLDKMYAFLCHARRVQEIKDSLLYTQSFGEESKVREEMATQQELMREIREIYHQKMIPLVGEIATFLQSHPEELQRLLEADAEEEDEDEL
ncbi:MAG: hypothetical protein HY319_30875 [Armatimonadetes bacterium]|nr:hypothetical protein [Armatimonadota bacterium]